MLIKRQTRQHIDGELDVSHSEVILSELITGNLIPNQTAAPVIPSPVIPNVMEEPQGAVSPLLGLISVAH